MRRRVRRSKRAAKPSSANGGSSTAPSPTVWRKRAIACSPSLACHRASGGAREPQTRSNVSMRSSSQCYDYQHQANDDFAGEGYTEGIQRDHHQHNRESCQMNGQTRNKLRGVISEGEGYDARADNPLSDVAAARDKGERVVMERSCPDERTAMLGEIDAELCTTDTRRQADQSPWDHCQQERAACLLGGRTKRAENARTNNHARGHQRGRGASERTRRGAW